MDNIGYKKGEEYDAENLIRIINELSQTLKDKYPTAWELLQSTKDARKLAELRVFLSMCKAKVDTSEMKKVLE